MSRRAGQRFDAEHGVVTEALVFLGSLDPDAVGASIEYATHYEASPVNEIDELLDASPLPVERATFVDVGSGMGRVVLVAARRPFAHVVGVEISPALHEIARDNLAGWRDTAQRCRDVRLMRGDALRFRVPRGDLVVYLYNPFRAEVLAPLVRRLVADRSREIVVLYHTPVERAVFDAEHAFELVATLRCGLVYRRRREAEAFAEEANDATTSG